MNISIHDDIERLLAEKVQAGAYPSREASVEAALARFLVDDRESFGAATRDPGPFLKNETTEAPLDLSRPGAVAHRSCVWNEVRRPDPTWSPSSMTRAR